MTRNKILIAYILLSTLYINQSLAHDLTRDYDIESLEQDKRLTLPKQPLNSSNENKKIELSTEILSQPIIEFSSSIVKDTAKVTQITILDKKQLKIAGIKETEIFNFINYFEEHAKNIFHSNTAYGGRFIYGIIIKPSIESAKNRAKALKLDAQDSNILDKICNTEPTHCSLTSLVSFQNNLIPQNLLTQFEKDIFESSKEIFWHNYKNQGEIKLYFEISLKNSI